MFIGQTGRPRPVKCKDARPKGTLLTSPAAGIENKNNFGNQGLNWDLNPDKRITLMQFVGEMR
jgi:hypothetical protein